MRSSIALLAAMAFPLTASATDFQWASPTSGNWGVPGNWQPAEGAPPNGLADLATLALVGTYTVNVNGRFTVGAATISNPQATLLIPDTSRLSIGAGSLQNDGLIQITGRAGVHFLADAGSTHRLISGSGTIQLDDRQADIDADPGVVVEIAADQRVRGRGKIGAALELRGTIVADSPLGEIAIESPTLLNTGSISARDGGVVLLHGQVTQLDQGMLVAEPGGLLKLDQCAVTGGSVAGLGGLVVIDTQATLNDVSLVGDVGVPGGAALIVAGPVLPHMGGNMALGGAGPVAGISEFVCFEPLSLIGSGTMTLTPGVTPAGEPITARLRVAPGALLTVGDGYTLEGTGVVVGNTRLGIPGTINATVDPGMALAAGRMDVDGMIEVVDGGVLHFDLFGAAAFDQIAVTGTVTLGGRLEVALAGGFDPLSGTAFTIMTAAGFNGAFSNVALPTLTDGKRITLVQTMDSLTIQVDACAADFNSDGEVNPDDLSDFITCFFMDVMFPGACGQADFNADGFRDPDDLSNFVTAFFLGC